MVQFAVFLYVAVALGLLIAGLVEYYAPYDKQEKRTGARRIIVAPVWPVALIVAVAWFVTVILTQELLAIWRTARSPDPGPTKRETNSG